MQFFGWLTVDFFQFVPSAACLLLGKMTNHHVEYTVCTGKTTAAATLKQNCEQQQHPRQREAKSSTTTRREDGT
jgi:hypothetical protein